MNVPQIIRYIIATHGLEKRGKLTPRSRNFASGLYRLFTNSVQPSRRGLGRLCRTGILLGADIEVDAPGTVLRVRSVVLAERERGSEGPAWAPLVDRKECCIHVEIGKL